jgi:hypothetical protein
MRSPENRDFSRLGNPQAVAFLNLTLTAKLYVLASVLKGLQAGAIGGEVEAAAMKRKSVLEKVCADNHLLG